MTVLRNVGALVAAFVLVVILLIGVEFFSAIVHPFPEGFDGSGEAMQAHVARYPHWVLAVAAVAWGFTAFAGTWTAGKLGSRVSAAILGVLLVAAVIFNISKLPYPMWFKVVSLTVVAAGVALGYRMSRRPG